MEPTVLGGVCGFIVGMATGGMETAADGAVEGAVHVAGGGEFTILISAAGFTAGMPKTVGISTATVELAIATAVVATGTGGETGAESGESCWGDWFVGVGFCLQFVLEGCCRWPCGGIIFLPNAAEYDSFSCCAITCIILF